MKVKNKPKVPYSKYAVFSFILALLFIVINLNIPFLGVYPKIFGSFEIIFLSAVIPIVLGIIALFDIKKNKLRGQTLAGLAILISVFAFFIILDSLPFGCC